MMRPFVARKRAEKGVRHVEHAIEIDRHDVLPVLDDGVRIGSEGVAAIDAGIVDEDRDLADLACDLGGGDAAGGSVGDVEREVLRLAAGFADVRGRCRGRLAIDVQHGDLRALAGIAKRDGAADAGACAGDDRDVILQKSGHCFPFLVNAAKDSDLGCELLHWRRRSQSDVPQHQDVVQFRTAGDRRRSARLCAAIRPQTIRL